MKKTPRQFYNATDAANYLRISRQRFYVVKDKHKLTKHKEGYSALELDKVRRLLNKWLKAHGK